MEAALENLSLAFNRTLYAEAGTLNEAQLQSRLFSACVEAGMNRDEPSCEDWAAARLAKWLLNA